jgi:hypothetical protein
MLFTLWKLLTVFKVRQLVTSQRNMSKNNLGHYFIKTLKKMSLSGMNRFVKRQNYNNLEMLIGFICDSRIGQHFLS